ncbi:MAG: hypothetical protein HKN03_03320 [Acidimicrobiales bacterium]|nr:hypothetical protein [Acidimicrobiales bacterium]
MSGFSWEAEDEGDATRTEPLLPTASGIPRHKGSILMAAMLGLGQALGMDDVPSEVPEAVAQTPDGPPLIDLDFGDLDPL